MQVVALYEDNNGRVGKCVDWSDNGSGLGKCAKMSIRIPNPDTARYFIRVGSYSKKGVCPFRAATQLRVSLDCDTAPNCEFVGLNKQILSPADGELAKLKFKNTSIYVDPDLYVRIKRVEVSEVPKQDKDAACPLVSYATGWQRAPFKFRLRAESNTGLWAHGRTYYIEYEANYGGDANPGGRTCRGRTSVCVPLKNAATCNSDATSCRYDAAKMCA